MLRRAILPVLFSICGAVFFSCPTWAAETVRKLRIGIPTRSMSSFPQMVAQGEGFYRNEGLQVEIIVVSSGTPAIQAVLAGDLDFATTGNVATIAAIRGMPVRNVMVSTTATDQVLVVKPEIRRVEDLRGKTLGVAGIRTVSDISTRLLLRKHGLSPDTDVKIVSLGGSGLRLTALKGGQIDGTLLSAPHNKSAVKLGFVELAFMKDVRKVPSGGLATSVRKIQNDPDSIVRAITATLKAIRFVKNDKEAALRSMAKELAMKDREIASMVYDDGVKLFSDTGIPSAASMTEEIETAKEILGITKDVSVSEVADWSFARAAFQALK
jgi:NitT/TauT family transport system substrate-binding protein